MRRNKTLAALALAGTCLTATAQAQTAINLNALTGLSPFSTLLSTPAGKAALAANYDVTGAIQNGTQTQPDLLPFPAQEDQALKDAAITSGNADQLADGLGTKLGTAYQSLVTVTSPDDGKTIKAIQYTNVSKSVATIIAYTYKLTGADSASGKYFFSNGTTDGKISVSPAAAVILKSADGTTDVFGKAYGLPIGAPKADPYGDSRPFQTLKTLKIYTGTDYFGVTQPNTAYLSGPVQNLVKSPAFPSGHTTYGYTESLLLALLVPQRYPEMVTRGAEYGNDRIILGAHYAMDVIGGRTLASYDLAHLLANDPAYVGQKEGKVTIADYQVALKAAKKDLKKALTTACGGKLWTCAKEDTSRFASLPADEAFYESTQTYGLPVVYPAIAAKTEDVGVEAPEAGYLLTAAFPYLSLKQADAILTETEGPGGGFLDNGSDFGVYSRIDLFKAALAAEKLWPHKA